MADWIDNITDKDALQDNLTFASIYIAMYEYITDYTVSTIKNFFCNIGIQDGKESCVETSAYRKEIKSRIVDDKGNKDITKASFLWLVENSALSQADYDNFLRIKEVRNKYAHELTNVIFEGVAEHEITFLFDMYSLHRKISKWFFVECGYPFSSAKGESGKRDR